MSVLVLNEDNFEKTISSGVTLVDFWAEWCGPCQQMLPILSECEESMWDKINVWKVNVDDNAGIASTFRVMSIPTLILFKDWKPVEQLVWVQQVDSLKELVSKYL